MRKPVTAAALAAALLASLTLGAAAAAEARAAQATSYSGRATALQASVLGIEGTFADTGPLPASGGKDKASLAGVNLLGVASADAVTASTHGQGNRSRSRSSLTDVGLHLPGLEIGATAARSEAEARCQGGEPHVSGISRLVGLTLNGTPIVVTEVPNVKFSLLGYTVVLNEQVSSTEGDRGDITVNALRITRPGVNVVLASSYADIECAEEPAPPAV